LERGLNRRAADPGEAFYQQGHRGQQRPCLALPIHFGVRQFFLQIRMPCKILSQRRDTANGIGAVNGIVAFGLIA
jgi:hypothetical protein